MPNLLVAIRGAKGRAFKKTMKMFVPVPISIVVEVISIVVRGSRCCFSDYRGRHYGTYPYQITAGALEPGGWIF